jgi:hypothetical protein
MARIQLKVWHAPLSVLASPPPVGLAEGEVAIAIETNTFVKRPDGNDTAALISLNGDSNFIKARAATNGPITLSGLQTIDGVFINGGEIVLVKDQTDKTKNGFYVASQSAWTRYSRAASTAGLASALAVVEAGTINGDTLWVCTVNSDAAPVGEADISFRAAGGGGTAPGGITEVTTVSFPSGSSSITESNGALVIGSTGALITRVPEFHVESSGQDLFRVNPDGTLYSKAYGDLHTKFGTVKSVNNKTGSAITLNAAEVGAVPTGNVGVANGVASLGADGKVPASQLPSQAAGMQDFTFQVNFNNTDPVSVANLPNGWNATITGTTVTVTHTAGKMPVGVNYMGYNTGSGQAQWRMRFPTAANEFTVPDASKNTAFSFVLTTSICAADLGGKALVNVQF